MCSNSGTISAFCNGSSSGEVGSVSGSAAAHAAFGTLGVFATYTHTGLNGTYVTEIGVAQAEASFTEQFSVPAAGKTTLLGFSFELSGSAIGPPNEANAGLFVNGAYLGYTQATVQVQSQFIEIAPGQTLDIEIKLVAYAARQNSDFGTSTVSFERTLHTTGVFLTDLDGKPVNLPLVTGSGTVYPVNPASAVPEPGAGVLAGLGLAGLAWRCRREVAA